MRAPAPTPAPAAAAAPIPTTTTASPADHGRATPPTTTTPPPSTTTPRLPHRLRRASHRATPGTGTGTIAVDPPMATATYDPRITIDNERTGNVTSTMINRPRAWLASLAVAALLLAACGGGSSTSSGRRAPRARHPPPGRGQQHFGRVASAASGIPQGQTQTIRTPITAAAPPTGTAISSVASRKFVSSLGSGWACLGPHARQAGTEVPALGGWVQARPDAARLPPTVNQERKPSDLVLAGAGLGNRMRIGVKLAVKHHGIELASRRTAWGRVRVNCAGHGPAGLGGGGIPDGAAMGLPRAGSVRTAIRAPPAVLLGHTADGCPVI